MLHFIAIWHKVQHTIIRKLDYIAAGGIINMVNMVNTAVNNNIYAGRKSGSKYNQSKAFQQKEVLETPDVAAVNKYANVQEIYEALKCNVSCRGYEQGQDEIAEKEIQNDEPEISNDSSEKMTVWYQGVPLEEWALTDPKYTDSETGISWYIRDGKYPYMVGEDAESDLFLQKMTNRTKITQKSSKKHSIDTISKLQFCSKEYIESTLSTIFPSLKTVLEEFW